MSSLKSRKAATFWRTISFAYSSWIFIKLLIRIVGRLQPDGCDLWMGETELERDTRPESGQASAASLLDDLLAIMMRHYVELIAGMAHIQPFGIVNYHCIRIMRESFPHKLDSLIEWKFHQLFIESEGLTLDLTHISKSRRGFSGADVTFNWIFTLAIALVLVVAFVCVHKRTNKLLNKRPRREFALFDGEGIIEKYFLPPAAFRPKITQRT